MCHLTWGYKASFGKVSRVSDKRINDENANQCGQSDNAHTGQPFGGHENLTYGEVATVETAAEVAARRDRKSTRLNSSHWLQSRMPSSA